MVTDTTSGLRPHRAPSYGLTRIVGIDVARSIAILLAMMSHVWVVARMGDFHQGAWVDTLRLIMAGATPVFVILFGTMLELVYLPRFRRGERKRTTAKLFSRAVQCWLLYALSVVVLFLTRDSYSVMFSIATILMLGVTPFTDILKFYAVVLILAPVLLWARCRLGLVPLLVGAVAIHVAYPLLTALPTPADFGLPVEVGRVWKFLFGLGDVQLGGPSVMRGITLVILGMAIGRILVGASDTNWDPVILRRHSAALLATTGGALAVLLMVLDQDAIHNLGSMSLRIAGHPLYFAVGALFAGVLTSGTVLVTTFSNSDLLWRRFAFFGRTSLFTFAFGNMLLYAVFITPDSATSALQLAATLIVAIVAISVWFDYVMRGQSTIGGTVRDIQQAITAVLEVVGNRWVAPFFRKPSAQSRMP